MPLYEIREPLLDQPFRAAALFCARPVTRAKHVEIVEGWADRTFPLRICIPTAYRFKRVLRIASPFVQPRKHSDAFDRIS
jgi:hypothetical protein